MPPGMIWEILIGSFGVAGAILLVGGTIYLRIQRDKQQYQLMQTALDKGITTMPGMIPGWLISLRQGMLALVLGLGVACSGIALVAMASSIDQIPAGAFAGPPGPDGRDGQSPPAPPGQPFPDAGPGMDGQSRLNPPGPDRRPPQNPAMERWHRVQTQKLTGLVAICSGAILAMLGLVRIAFSRMERQYTSETPTAPSPSRTAT
jgi:hypothetical protein